MQYQSYEYNAGQVHTARSSADVGYMWQPNVPAGSADPFNVGDGPPATGDAPDNIVACDDGDGDVGMVDADFDSGGDGYDASDFGPVADNIIVDD
jgi:hypothetical protein